MQDRVSQEFFLKIACASLCNLFFLSKNVVRMPHIIYAKLSKSCTIFQFSWIDLLLCDLQNRYSLYLIIQLLSIFCRLD